LKDARKLLALLLDLLSLVVVLTAGFAVVTNLGQTLAKNANVYTTAANGSFQHIDFISYYMAGTLARADSKTRSQAYDPAVQLAQYNAVIAPAKIDRPIFFNYPPYAFSLMVPFSLMPLRSAYLLWDALSLLAGVGALILAGRAVGKLNLLSLVGLVACFALSFPGCDALMDGQMTWWFMAFIALAYLGVKGNNDYLAGAATAMLALKPHFFLFMVIPLIVSKRKKAILVCALAMAMLLLLATVTLGFENVINYPKIVLAGENVELCPMTFPERMVCLRGPASIFLTHDWYMRLAFGGFVIGLAAFFHIFKKALSRAGASISLEMAYGLAIPLLLTLSPHMHVYDCALLAIPAVLLLPSIRPSQLLTAKTAAPFKIYTLLVGSYFLLSWLIMIAAPALGGLLPAAVQAKLSVNDIPCALLSFYLYLVLDVVLVLLLAASLSPALSSARGAEKVSSPLTSDQS